MKIKVLTLVAIAAMALSGCEIINMTRAASLMADYNLFASGDAIFNSQDSNQYLIPPSLESNKNKMLVCYMSEGLFADTDEQPLRNAANEYLKMNKPNMVATSGENRSGVWESRTCYEFKYEDKDQPIGAYLDEKTGEVIIVGEADIDSATPVSG